MILPSLPLGMVCEPLLCWLTGENPTESMRSGRVNLRGPFFAAYALNFETPHLRPEHELLLVVS